MTTTDERRPEKVRRPLLRSFRFWIPMGILLLLIVIAVVGAIAGKHVYDRAMSAKGSLEQAMPLASKAADAVLAGDTEDAKAVTAQLATLTGEAKKQTDDGVWKALEWVPVAGPNLYAVRTAAAVTDDLVRDALTPATELSLDALKPKDGAIDLAGIEQMQSVVTQATKAVNAASDDLGTIDSDALIPQVSGALDQLTGTVNELQPMLAPASEILGVLPTALGAEAPRNYLMIFQNNAESRGTGGNPAALVMITVDKGKISIGQQASSGNFKNGRPDPVAGLTPETKALYGDKVARWISDATMTPDFTESAAIVRSWWAEEFGTPIDAVVSFDPVALSYLLKATGPAVVPNDPIEFNGQTLYPLEKPLTLTAENAVPFLLNEVYWKYEPAAQDAIFAASAKSVFDVLTAGNVEPKQLLDSLTRAVDEGRLMYQPATEDEAKLVAESKLSGKLPSTNDDSTALAVYVNDFTQSKLDYYMQLDVAAETTQCTAPDAPTFALTATLTNTVTPEMAPDLPRSIAPAKYFEKGRVATNLVFYGPVGATSATVTVDGAEQSRKSLPHLGRPAVMVPVYNDPGQKHTVTVEFHGAKGEYGPLEVRHTPMVRETPVELSTPGCG
ncbi:DUF4012 domain-containing protein [Microbacterium sp. H1-D42]|uniref:DUF4012 domain-containing protein n=1 Tax=Microbacterium sp. H1-D42 TaxID=2925844 RepID=UPI001F533CD5|nr:DUF4012 domain-containing protein [Microbacterium sp. H1-D42]UNK70106.1 DUF4012 domain-containing protein [Microbacterium sp. H1-D42]